MLSCSHAAMASVLLCRHGACCFGGDSGGASFVTWRDEEAGAKSPAQEGGELRGAVHKLAATVLVALRAVLVAGLFHLRGSTKPRDT